MDMQEDFQGQASDEPGPVFATGTTGRTRRLSHVVTDNFDGRGTTQIVTTVGSSDSSAHAASEGDVEMMEAEDEEPGEDEEG
eukprot:1303703-Heterocapsa_arctica.AAC.1